MDKALVDRENLKARINEKLTLADLNYSIFNLTVDCYNTKSFSIGIEGDLKFDFLLKLAETFKTNNLYFASEEQGSNSGCPTCDYSYIVHTVTISDYKLDN